MIYYDSHKWRTLAKARGSVLPKAVLWALPAAILAVCLKWQEDEGNVSLESLAVLTQGDIYSGFTFVLGFSLVFRTSQSYLRYWTAATSVHEMGCQWTDSCASLIAFSTTSQRPRVEVLRFRHTVVRLFSLLHAMALEEMTSGEDDLRLLDVDGLGKDKLTLLTSGLAQGRKVQIVLSWIKAYITQMADMGILSVPAPILTRVFQELAAGLVSFHQAHAIVLWPFPFPYTQLNLLLIQVYTMITPLVICTWATSFWMCGLVTFVSVTCMIGLDLIASELENPFGDDPNDLPVQEMQMDINKLLTMQLNPAIHTPPELLPSAIMDYDELAGLCSLTEKDLKRNSSFKAMSSLGSRRAHMRYYGQASMDAEVLRVQHWLKCLPSQTQDALQEAVQRQRPSTMVQVDETSDLEQRSEQLGDHFDAMSQATPTSPTQSHGILRMEQKAMPPMSARGGLQIEEKGQAPTFESRWRAEESPLSAFLSGLRGELKEHLDNQLEMQRNELKVLEGMLVRSVQDSQVSVTKPSSTLPSEPREPPVRLPRHSSALSLEWKEPESLEGAMLPPRSLRPAPMLLSWGPCEREDAGSMMVQPPEGDLRYV